MTTSSSLGGSGRSPGHISTARAAAASISAVSI
jgi:hypothetical protein